MQKCNSVAKCWDHFNLIIHLKQQRTKHFHKIPLKKLVIWTISQWQHKTVSDYSEKQVVRNCFDFTKRNYKSFTLESDFSVCDVYFTYNNRLKVESFAQALDLSCRVVRLCCSKKNQVIRVFLSGFSLELTCTFLIHYKEAAQ